MQPLPTLHTEKASKPQNDLQHCLLLACQESLLSRELIRLIKMKVFEDGHLIKSFELFEFTIWLLVQGKKHMELIL